MPLIDFKALFLRAQKTRAKKLLAAKARIALEEQEAAERLAKQPPGKRTKKRAPQGPSKQPNQSVCRRRGCYNEGPFTFGVCKPCWNVLRNPTVEGCARPYIDREQHFERGQKALISQSHANPLYRGVYVTVVTLEDDGALVLVELDGDSIRAQPTAGTTALRGRRIRVVVDQLLPVEL